MSFAVVNDAVPTTLLDYTALHGLTLDGVFFMGPPQRAPTSAGPQHPRLLQL